MAKGKIRILLADDHNVLRQGLRAMLELEADIEVVADVADGRTAVKKTRALKPDVVVMDIGMPGLNGIDATRQIVADPGDAHVLCLSVHRETQLVHAMLAAGANGYLLKTSVRDELIRAVRTVAAGETYLSPPIAGDVVVHHVRGEGEKKDRGAFRTLSEREREVLQLIAEGFHTDLIASRLHISPRTVLAHRENIMHKLSLDSVVALTRYAIREGISEP